jgi:hypothetical protein
VNRSILLTLASIALAGCGASPAYDYEPGATDAEEAPARQGAWTQGEELGTPFALGQRWVGSYHCPQGETAMVLHITDVDGGRLKAVFEFEHTESGAKGMYEMAGGYTPDRNAVALFPGRWLRQPEGYETVGMRGTVSVGGKRFLGVIEHEGCTTFSLRLVR